MDNTTARPAAAASPGTELRALIGVASQIARHGYGEPIVDLALRRKGVNRNAARLIAASVVSCHTTLVRVQAQALAQSQREQAYKQAARLAEIRAARAASYALRKLAAFALFVLIGLGGGAYLGWSAGFNLGIDEGFDWIVRTIDRRIAG
jgi:hypothetical protein